MELSKNLNRNITLVLINLILLDVILSVWAWFFPEWWFQIFHGVPYDDPQGFLRRCAGNWTAFALFQFIALLRWKKAPHWIVVVAGVRFSDILTDWSYLAFCSDITIVGSILLFAASPLNLIFGIYLMVAYGKLSQRPSH